MAPGEEVVVASLAGVPVGLTLCYDLRFPELYRRLAAWGARLVTVPAAFTMDTGQGPLGGPAAGPRHREPGVRARGRPVRLASPGPRLLRELDDRGPVGHRRRPRRATARAWSWRTSTSATRSASARPCPRSRTGAGTSSPSRPASRPVAGSGGRASGTEGTMPGNLDLKELESPRPAGRDRHGADGLPRRPGPPDGQARRRPPLPRAHRGRGGSRLRLPPHRRRGHGALARLQVRLVGHAATRT